MTRQKDDCHDRSTVHRDRMGGLRKITAIIRPSALKAVEERLQTLRVPGISVSRVKGYGEYANFFRSDWVCDHARIEIYCRRERTDEIAQAIIASARTGNAGDGIVVVLPVEAIYRIRTGRLAAASELGGSGGPNSNKNS